MFVGLDKLTPRDDSNSKSSKKGESYQSNIGSRIKETVMPEETCSQGDIEKLLKIGQRVVTFLENNRPLRGCVRFIGKDKSRPIVGLELVS